MKSKFFENLLTFGSDLVEYVQGWDLWRVEQETNRSAAGAIAAILKYNLRKQTIFKIIEAWDPISDAVESNGLPLPMERDIQAYDAQGNMVDMERLLNEAVSIFPSTWGLKSFTRQQIELSLELLLKKHSSDIRVEFNSLQGTPAREFMLR